MSQWILAQAALKNPHGKYCFAVHRRGLVENASQSFADDLPHGVIMSGNDTHGGMPVQVASIDTLNKWYIDEGRWLNDYTFDLVIFDECHSHLSKLITMSEAMDAKREELGLPEAVYIGLSATPRCEGINWFRSIVNGPDCTWLQDQGYAATFEYYSATLGRLDKLKKSGRTFTEASISTAMAGLGGALVRDWKQYAEGVPTVGFFPRLAHAQEAQEQLRAAGVRAEYVDGTTTDEERNRIYRDLDTRRIDYICNVGVIERGTDLGVGCVQLCTAVGTEERYLQMIGRGSRVNDHAPTCTVIDHGGNVARHGFWEDARTWELDWTVQGLKEQATRTQVACPSCGRIYRGGKCTACEYEPRAAELKQQGLEFDGGEMRKIEQATREKKPVTSEAIMIKALAIAGKTGKTVGQAVAMGYRMGAQEGISFSPPVKVYGVKVPTKRDTAYRSPASYVFPWTKRKRR